MEVRKNLGYMTQAFSLYGELSVRQNLVLHARLYHLPPDKAEARIEELVKRFGLGNHVDALAGICHGPATAALLAVAVLHAPQILILDEPTSGVDPVARDSFWELLIDLSRKQGVTIFVTTHFMNEGMRCDRISLMHAGKVLAADTPQKLIEGRGAATLEEAFIGYMEDAIEDVGTRGASPQPEVIEAAAEEVERPLALPRPLPVRVLGRLLAYAYNEAMEIVRDPSGLGFAFVGFGAADARLRIWNHHGCRTHPLRVARSRSIAGQPGVPGAVLARARYFSTARPALSADEALDRLQSDDVSMVIEIPPTSAGTFAGARRRRSWRRWTAR